MRLIGQEEQQAIDQFWQKQTGLPLLLLMESAARAVADMCMDILKNGGKTERKKNSPQVNPISPSALTDQIIPAKSGTNTPPDIVSQSEPAVLVLAGKGQNGGDAFACARMLAGEGVFVICRELDPGAPQPAEAEANRQALQRMGLPLGAIREEDFSGKNLRLIVDGLFGTGFQASRGLPEGFEKISCWCEQARSRGVQLIAVDIPSGLDSRTGIPARHALKADMTLTFVLPKAGLFAEPGFTHAGTVYLAPIGIAGRLAEHALSEVDQPACYLIDDAVVKPVRSQLKRDPLAHKGRFGRLMLIAGSPGMPGAAVLTARAAARSGLGMLHLLTADGAAAAVVDGIPEAMVESISFSDGDAFLQAVDTGMKRASAVAAGPGIGRAEQLLPALERIIDLAQQTVLDADALNVLSDRPDEWWRRCERRVEQGLPPVILTPHPGEYRRLAPDLADFDRQKQACLLAQRSHCVVVLKGSRTVVAAPDGEIYINQTGNNGLARGGSGDLLTGLIAGLLAQGIQPLQAALAGVYYHGLAADLAAEKLSRRGMLPEDLLGSLSDAYRLTGWE